MLKKLSKVSVVGHFGIGENLLNGQTVKTKIITTELERRFGEHEVVKTDTHGGIKKLLTMPFALLGVLKKCKNVIIFPAHNGLRVIAPILVVENMFFHRKLHYVVIGGWLPEFLKSRKLLAYILKKFDCIYVETNTMKKALELQGFSNIMVMPNCKELKILKEDELVYPTDKPYKLCTFSRVMKEKGIEDAINAVKYVNEKYNETVFTLDIYGQIESNQTEWFENLKKTFPEYINYGGCVEFDKSTDVLKDYLALLFPTHFYTEGIPGTIIDAYAAGVPVISSRWESFDDVVDDNESGFGYEFSNGEHLIELLLKICENPNLNNTLKVNCIKKARSFLTSTVIDILENKLL